MNSEVGTLTGQSENQEIQAELALVKRLLEVIAQTSGLAQVYQAFAGELERCVGADWVAAALIEDDEVQIYPLEKPDEGHTTLPLAETTLGRLVAAKRAIVETGQSVSACTRLGCPVGARSIAWLPLMTSGEVFGALVVASFRDSAYL